MTSKLDNMDRAILLHLADNARLPAKTLAGLVGLSRAALSARIEKLERAGHIAGYTLKRPRSAGQIGAVIFVTGSTPRCEAVAKLLRPIEAVRRCISLSGPVDMIVELETTDPDEIPRIRDLIAAQDNIVNVTLAMRLKEYLSRT